MTAQRQESVAEPAHAAALCSSLSLLPGPAQRSALLHATDLDLLTREFMLLVKQNGAAVTTGTMS